MKKTLFLLTLTLTAISQAVVLFEDGLSHTIDDTTYQNEFIRLDYNVVNSPGTHLKLMDHGSVDQLYLHNTSTLNMTGGTIGSLLRGWDRSTISISAGTITDFYTLDNSEATITGGTITDELAAGFNSTITMSGGSFGSIRAYYNGIIYLVGSGFEVDGQPLSYGDKLSDYGTFYPWISVGLGFLKDYYSGTISGTLADGTYINSTFYVSSEGASDIFIIPEPATLSLLAVGVLTLRRKR